MSALKLILYGILYGLRDSILGGWAVWFIDEDAKKSTHAHSSRSQKPVKSKDESTAVWRRVSECVFLNGGVLGMSSILFNYVCVPAAEYIVRASLGSAGLIVWSYFYPVLHFIFSAVWILPLFVVSRVINSFWFMDIADRAYRQSRGRPQMISSFSKFIADTLFSVVIQIFFLLQSTLVTLVPLGVVGDLVAILHLALLFSLYAFEYRWFNMGWELHNRLGFIENNWPYFFGFGLPMAVATFVAPTQFSSGCIFSVFFPLLIISANEAEPLTNTCDFSLQLFSPVVALSNWLFHHATRRRKLRK